MSKSQISNNKMNVFKVLRFRLRFQIFDNLIMGAIAVAPKTHFSGGGDPIDFIA